MRRPSPILTDVGKTSRRRRAMANNRMDFSSFVSKLLAEEDTDVLREGVRVLAQALMDAEVSTQIGAERYERTDARTARRNGSTPGGGTPGWARWNSRCRRSSPAPTSP